MQTPETQESVSALIPGELPPPLVLVPAPRGHRFVTVLLDQLFIGGAAFVYLFVLTFVLAAVFGVDSLPVDDPFGGLMTLGVGIVYYLLQETLWGRTLGKLVTGTKAVRKDGGKLGFGRTLLRTLCRFIPFEGVTFLNRDARGWHDTLSGTRVVMVKKIQLRN